MASKVLARANRIELAASRTTVTLSAPRLEASLRSGRVQLLARGLRAREAPGVLYHLYLNLPDGAKPDDAHFVGSINFYNARPDSDPDAIIYSFDVTDLARALHSRGNVTVTIIPSGTPAPAAHPSISRLELRAD